MKEKNRWETLLQLVKMLKGKEAAEKLFKGLKLYLNAPVHPASSQDEDSSEYEVEEIESIYDFSNSSYEEEEKDDTSLVGEDEIEAEKDNVEVEDREASVSKKEEIKGLKRKNVKKEMKLMIRLVG